jgi:hypothetical protein
MRRRRRHVFLRVTVLQMTLLTPSRGWLTVRTVDLLYLLSTGLPDIWVMTDKDTLRSETVHHLAVACFTFVKCYYCWGKRDTDITIPWHWTNDSPHCLRLLCKKCICFWQLLCKWGISQGYFEDNWSTQEWFYMSFYCNIMKHVDTFVYLDSCMLMTTKKALIR